MVLCKIITSIRVSEWRGLLATYPDKRFANLLLRGLGIESGLRIGLIMYKSIQLRSHYLNFLSAMDHLQVVQDYLDI